MRHSREVGGVTVPSFMYGTAWKEERTRELVLLAIESGFRAIDTANQRRHYVEAAVGEAVASALGAGHATRSDLFLQTKFTYARGQDHRLPYDPTASYAEQVAQSFASSLEHLGTDYVDSYVLHGPAQGRGIAAADREVWSAMEQLVAQGKVRFLGVSNVSLEQLASLCELAKVPPAFVQNRCFARDGWDRDVRAYCTAHGLSYQGFSLLTANGRELASPVIERMCAKYGRSVPELVFRFALDVGMLPLTGTSSPAHMRQDLGVFDFELEASDRERISSLASRAPGHAPQ